MAGLMVDWRNGHILKNQILSYHLLYYLTLHPCGLTPMIVCRWTSLTLDQGCINNSATSSPEQTIVASHNVLRALEQSLLHADNGLV